MERIGDEVAMRQHDSLRPASRATGIKERGNAILVHGWMASSPAAGAHVDELLVIVGNGHDALDARRQRPRIAVGDEDARARVDENRIELRLGEPSVQRHDDHPMCGDGAERLEETVAVGREQSDAVSGPHADALQSCGEPDTPLVKRAIIESHVAIDDRDVRRVKASGMFEGVREGQQGRVLSGGGDVDDDIAEQIRMPYACKRVMNALEGEDRIDHWP